MYIRELVLSMPLFIVPAVYAEECPGFGADTIRQSPVFQAGVQEAWNRSTDADVLSEEGFNIYQCWYVTEINGRPEFEYRTELDWSSGGRRHEIPMPASREDRNCRIVAQLHTHPDDTSVVDTTLEAISTLPSWMGLSSFSPRVFEDDPSPGDIDVAANYRAPTFIVWKNGLNSLDGPLIAEFFPLSELRPYWTCGPCTGVGSADGELCPIDTGAPTAPGAPGAEEFGPPRPAQPRPVSYTDPHLVTMDGLNYSFQAVGEFVLAQSDASDLMIQSRQTRYGSSSSQVSVNTGFGFNLDGSRVSIVISPSGDTVLFIDDVEQSQVGEIRLDSGSTVTVNSSSYELAWSDGSIAVVADRGNFMNLSLALSAQHQGRLAGLLGDFDGNIGNDIVTSSGENLTTRISADDLYGIFADGWRVDDESSLLYYYEGQDTAFFTDRLFPGRAVRAEDLDDATRTAAEDTCRAAGVSNRALLEDCILDVGFSSDESFADAIQSLQEFASADVVDADVQGDIGIPSRVCSMPDGVDALGSPIPNLSGVYTGTLTHPDSGTTWDTEITIEQCGSIVYGLLTHTTPGGFANRRFEGMWQNGQLSLQVAYPYLAESPTGVSSWCENMTFLLQYQAERLFGTWGATNCPLSGDLDVDLTITGAPNSSADPTQLVGEWSGPVDQPNSNTAYNAQLNFSQLPSDTLEGTIMYPELACSSTLAYLREENRYFVFQESVVTGIQACTDQGTVSVRLLPDDTLEWIYRAPNTSSVTARAKLTRQ